MTRAATAEVTMTKTTQGQPRPYIVALLKKEAWRGELTTGLQELCSGTLQWDGSPFWLCSRCGRVSNLKYDRHTEPPRFQRMKSKSKKKK